MFFSILPNDYEMQLKDEIWGCFRHIGIPIETVMGLPIQDRRYYIQKHNEEQEGIKRTENHNKGTISNNGDLNAYARMEQSNAKTRGGAL